MITSLHHDDKHSFDQFKWETYLKDGHDCLSAQEKLENDPPALKSLIKMKMKTPAWIHVRSSSWFRLGPPAVAHYLSLRFISCVFQLLLLRLRRLMFLSCRL